MTDEELKNQLRDIAQREPLPEKAQEIITAAADRIDMMHHIIETQGRRKDPAAKVRW